MLRDSGRRAADAQKARPKLPPFAAPWPILVRPDKCFDKRTIESLLLNESAGSVPAVVVTDQTSESPDDERCNGCFGFVMTLDVTHSSR